MLSRLFDWGEASLTCDVLAGMSRRRVKPRFGLARGVAGFVALICAGAIWKGMRKSLEPHLPAEHVLFVLQNSVRKLVYEMFGSEKKPKSQRLHSSGVRALV